MNRSMLLAGVAASALMVSTTVLAGKGHHGGISYYDDAEVVDVEPIVRVVHVPSSNRECWDEEVTRYGAGGSYTPIVLGGIIGGAVGHEFGKGRGKDAMTVAGTILGASIGRDIARQDAHPYTVTERRCRMVHTSHEEERIDGYRVTYRYRGQTFVTRMEHDPGERIRVRVTVKPVRW